MKILYPVLLLFLFSASIVNAGICSSTNTSGTCDSGYTCNNGVCQKNTTSDISSGGTVTLTDPLGIGNTASGPQQLIGKIIKGVLGLVGSLALAMFVYGGFTWMLAAGNSKEQFA